MVVGYTFEDVVKSLEAVAKFDWRAFWNTRLQTTQPGAPLEGLKASGWKLDYGETIPEMQRAAEDVRKVTDVKYSIGITVSDEGRIPDVLPGSPAAAAGIGPGMKLVAVNGRRWNRDILREAIHATKSGKPLELLVENTEYFKSYRLEYAGGERYPFLSRDESKPDLLSRIIQPLTVPPATPSRAAAAER